MQSFICIEGFQRLQSYSIFTGFDIPSDVVSNQAVGATASVRYSTCAPPFSLTSHRSEQDHFLVFRKLIVTLIERKSRSEHRDGR